MGRFVGSNADAVRIKEAIRDCQNGRREALTPSAAKALFFISDAAVRAARAAGRVEAAFEVSVTAKRVYLLRLDSALEYWKHKWLGRERHLTERVARMRDSGTIISVDGEFYNVLHTAAVASRTDPS